MGEARKRRHDPESVRQRQLTDAIARRELPCIFCSGEAVATTIDHTPARSFFRQRRWPEGCTFPACEACNKSSKDAERRLAVVTRMGPFDVADTIDLGEMERHLSHLARHEPNLLHAMRRPLTNGAKAALLSAMGIPVGYSADLPDLPVIHLPKALQDDAINYAAKLAKALHFRHTGSIVPRGASIFVLLQTNANVIKDEFPAAVLGVIRKVHPSIRDGQQIADQFAYRGEFAPDGSCSAMICKFRASLVTVMMVSKTPTLFETFEQRFGPPTSGGARLFKV
jgi:hypothetical protein